MKKFALISAISLGFATSNAFAVSSKTRTQRCIVPFAKNSTKLDANKLENCVSKIPLTEIKYFEVFATSTSAGTPEYNRKLSDKRAVTIKKYLNKRFAGITVSPLGGGENPVRGAQAQVIAVLVDQPPQRIVMQKSSQILPKSLNSEQLNPTGAKSIPEEAISETKPETVAALNLPPLGTTATPVAPVVNQKIKMPQFRAAVRGGSDSFKKNRTSYPAFGAELAWLPDTQEVYLDPKQVRLETGIQGTSMTRDDYLNLYNTYGFAGGAYKYDDFAFGARALMGAAWNSRNQQRFDGGAELRIGYEKNNVSVFAGAGATVEFTRIGLDLGLTF